MDIVFFGSGEFGVPTLARLASPGSGHRVIAVVTQPDRPAGRGGKVTPTPVAQWAAANLPGARLLKPERVSDPRVVEELRHIAHAAPSHTAVDAGLDASLVHRDANSACFVVIAFGQKMPRPLLEGVFAINLHASLLPRWRGAAPINAAILAGDPETGNSVITLADRMDAGLILGQSRRAIDPMMTAGELHDLLSADGPGLVMRVLDEHARRMTAAGAVVQDESLVTKAAKLSKADGVLDFTRGADECRRRVHGLTPWPGVALLLGDVPLKVLRVRVAPGAGPLALPTGSLFDVNNGLIACGGDTVLQLLSVQPAGKRAMGWDEFVRGRTIAPGTPLKPPARPAE
ncbi:MAG: methionyl-tRNA formyltransferase [Phycisphaerales bacterium]